MCFSVCVFVSNLVCLCVSVFAFSAFGCPVLCVQVCVFLGFGVSLCFCVLFV